MHICIDGIDGSGKTTIVQMLKKKYPEYTIWDAYLGIRPAYSPSSLKIFYDDTLPNSLNQNVIYIVLDAAIQVCIVRLNASKRESEPLYIGNYSDNDEDIYVQNDAQSKLYTSLFKYRNRYTRLAIRYQLYFINNTKQTPNETFECVEDILIKHMSQWKMGNKSKYLLPNPDLIDVSKLPIIVEGCSKIVRSYDTKYNIIEYKPTVYSHKQQKEGIVEGTHLERMRMTKNILYLLEKHEISHAYVYVGNQYVLCKKLDPQEDIPNVEVIVKRCHVGSDPYRYYKMADAKTRFGYPLLKERGEYPSLIVRFDWRNPNRHPEKGTPMGDEAMCDDLADYFINIESARDLATKTFVVLMNYFEEMNVRFKDCCFMITTDGSMHWSEISQDCGRYELIHESGYTSLDKDVWRAGESSELVFQKWSQMSAIVNEYVRNNY